MPRPILKPILAGKPVPLGVAHKATVQRQALYTCHHEIGDDLTKENKVVAVVKHIGIPIEYMESPYPL